MVLGLDARVLWIGLLFFFAICFYIGGAVSHGALERLSLGLLGVAVVLQVWSFGVVNASLAPPSRVGVRSNGSIVRPKEPSDPDEKWPKTTLELYRALEVELGQSPQLTIYDADAGFFVPWMLEYFASPSKVSVDSRYKHVLSDLDIARLATFDKSEQARYDDARLTIIPSRGAERETYWLMKHGDHHWLLNGSAFCTIRECNAGSN